METEPEEQLLGGSIRRAWRSQHEDEIHAGTDLRIGGTWTLLIQSARAKSLKHHKL